MNKSRRTADSESISIFVIQANILSERRGLPAKLVKNEIIIWFRRDRISLSWEIWVDPEILDGKPVINGTRIPVELIFELAGLGYTVQQIVEEYPHLSPETVNVSSNWANWLLW